MWRDLREANVAIFVIHRPGDSVGVATQDLDDGRSLTGRYRDLDDTVTVTAKGTIPLGHKVAVAAMHVGDVVVEYGEQIGVATRNIEPGEHVHVHNMQGQRWA